MRQKMANIDIRVEPQLVERIDAWRARQRVSPSRSAAIVYMLEQFLDHDSPELNAAWKRLLSKA
jgi:metal-responsive CopG/Arc/MetJ family transcriptional regulator